MKTKKPTSLPAFFFYISLFFWACPASAQPNNRLVDSLAKDFLDQNRSSCIVIGIIDHGVQKIYCYGHINKNGSALADSNTLFEIGSDTKLFTAAAAAVEVSEGKLKYDDSLSMLLHGLHVPSYYGHEIKIIDLLHHTSGLPRIPSDLFTMKGFDSVNPYKIYSTANLDNFISGCKLATIPGTSYAYSNLGFGLMGDILSEIEGKSYETIIREKIWKPLNMDRSTIVLTADQKRRIASPYNENGDPDHNWDFDAMAGAGAIRSDISDMVKFLKAAMNPINIKDSTLKNAFVDCQTRLFNADNGMKVGLGWHSQPYNHDRLYFHGGETGGFYSFIGFTKEGQKGVVLLTNSHTITDPIALKILGTNN